MMVWAWIAGAGLAADDLWVALLFASLGVASNVVFAVGLRGDRARSLAGLMFLEVVFAAMLRLAAGVLDLTVGELARIVAIVACVTAFVVRRERGR